MAEAKYNESFTYSVSGTEWEAARALAEDALERFRRLGDRRGEGKALWGVVNSYVFDEDIGPSLELVDQSLEIARELDDRFQLGWGLFTRGLIFNRAGETEASRAAYVEALEIFRETNDLTGYALVLDGLAVIAWVEGDHERAMRIAGAAAEIQDVQQLGLAEINRRAGGFFPQDMLDQAPLATAFAEGRKLSIEEAIALATSRDAPTEPVAGI